MSNLPPSEPKPSPDNSERKYVIRGIIFATIVMLCAGSVFYDDVYSDGVPTTFRSKVKRIMGNKNYKEKTEIKNEEKMDQKREEVKEEVDFEKANDG